MPIIKLLFISILAISVCSGCAFAPKTAHQQPYANDCEMSTKMMTLDQPRTTKAVGCQRSGNGAEFLSCLFVSGVLVPAGSFVISGSIVLINNTVHWLEYQGTCDKKQLQEKTEQLKKQQPESKTPPK